MHGDAGALIVYAEWGDAAPGDEWQAAIAHVGSGGADVTLCRLPVRRFLRCPDLTFTPRPAGMTRCSKCFTAYAVLPLGEPHEG